MSQDKKLELPEAPPSVEPVSSRTVMATTGLKLVAIRPAADSIVDSGPALSGPPPSRVDPLVGCTVDNRYKIESLLGEGGMGVVYRCRHKIIDKKVAMKVLRADLARDHEVTERFLTEAKAASTIGDEHIIDISDFGLLPDGSTYFVMEYLDGQPLSKVLEGGNPVPVPRILHIAHQLAEGLAAAHEAGIVHRDLKPDNIYLITRGADKDFVKILDFGIAKVSTSAAGQLTRAGSVFGTPHYMSPEQAAGVPVDHRGDVYSFGVILYELSCGKVPFDADNFMGILTQHMYKAPVPIRALVPPPVDVPPGLEAVILKCMSKRPEQRYASMRDLMVDLEKLKGGLVPEAVAEMMARSGGFNVPADFFKTGRMPAPVPATPSQGAGKNLSIYAGVAGVAVAIGLVIAIFSHSSPAPASSAIPVAHVPAPPPPVAASTNDIVVSVPVAIAIEPIDSVAFRDEKSLGTSPVVVDVPEGGTVTLSLKHAGYVTRELLLDGKQSKVVVRLEKDKPPPGVVRPRVVPMAKAQVEAPKPKPKGNLGGGEIVNPWAH